MSMFQQDAPSVFSELPMPQMPQPKRKGGMFGGVSIDPGAFLAAFAAGLGNPAGLQALRSIHDKRMAAQQQQLEDQQYQHHRSDQMSDWIAQQQYKAAHPDPTNPHYWEDNTGNLMAIGPDGKPQVVFEDPNPWKFIPNGMGGVVPVNVRAYMGGQGASPQKPIGKLTPIDEGGPASSAPGGFL